ncbi:ABC transporter ATP-binding protein [Bradyrhizobium yuanmingense]|uniref:ABC transporter ATP-binding protein n=1 Tax=Bradyrhizobium yuanmingense TaxID=108015 RepID=UPI0023B8F141|nr:ABC transporter ATP-binding protein [Bradyrhizobium yuanmingense]MDF0520204.1 ABC transporter ATP-binding protein [Bradyrhizobium yuanmingense]
MSERPSPSAGSEPVIALDGVAKSFAGTQVIGELSFRVRRGEIVTLLGRTGAGKTTVLNLVMGTTPPDAGSVRVAGHDPFRQFKALRGHMAVSFQTDRLLPWRTAVENAELGLLILGKPKRQAREIAASWLGRVGLSGAEDRYVHELSGGMRQRVSLARALAVDPELVLLDESFSQLDHVTSSALRRDFCGLARQFGKTCLMVTHRIDDAIEMADRVIVLGARARIRLEAAVPAASEDGEARDRLRHDIETALGPEAAQDSHQQEHG